MISCHRQRRANPLERVLLQRRQRPNDQRRAGNEQRRHLVDWLISCSSRQDHNTFRPLHQSSLIEEGWLLHQFRDEADEDAEPLLRFRGRHPVANRNRQGAHRIGSAG